MKELFIKLNLNMSLLDALNKQNITAPTDVQQKVIPQAMLNNDLIVQSETGTGKTLAFLIPLFNKIDFTKKEMQAMILAPTHELAVQIQKQIERLSINSDIKINGATIIGNVNIKRQVDKLKEKPHIIVGSPGRILELIKMRKINAQTIKTIVLDEADRLIDKNNLDNIRAIIKCTLRERQLMMFSASISKEAEKIGNELMKEPEIIKAQANISVPTTIQHLYFTVELRDKIETLRKLVGILNPKKAIIFVKENGEINNITEKLKHHKLNVESIHGSDRKLDRKKAMDDFRNGKIQLLVASDIAARGLDIEGVTHIFNMSLPEDAKDYLHRVGRTGRIGNAGTAISIVTQRELPLIKMCQRELKIEMVQKDMYKGNLIDAKNDEVKIERVVSQPKKTFWNKKK